VAIQTPTTERGETTRRHILEVAAGAFARDGYAGASLNDLIRATGLTKGGFYFHYPSKEALALDVLRYKQEQWTGRVAAAVSAQPRAVDQLTTMVDALCTLHEEDPSAKSIGKLCRELAEDRQLAPQLMPQFTTWVDLTSALFARAQAEGDMRVDLDARIVGEMAVASFLGLELISEVTGDQPGDLRRRAQRMVLFFFAAAGSLPPTDHM
jgi:AcrR family transcriptional regulator